MKLVIKNNQLFSSKALSIYFNCKKWSSKIPTWNVVGTHEVDHVASGHEFHHEVEVAAILEWGKKGDDPLRARFCHNIPLIPEKRWPRVATLFPGLKLTLNYTKKNWPWLVSGLKPYDPEFGKISFNMKADNRIKLPFILERKTKKFNSKLL